MATRRRGTKPPAQDASIAIPSTDTIETRLVSFAEEIGRVAGTVLGKADGWMDRDALTQRLATVRDGAAGLLEQLAATDAAVSPPAPAAKRAAQSAAGRSGGTVDAAGKKHRKPAPPDPGVLTVRSQAAKTRLARPMAKTHRRRGRG